MRNRAMTCAQSGPTGFDRLSERSLPAKDPDRTRGERDPMRPPHALSVSMLHA